MKKPLFTLVAVTALFFTSCIKEPSACIDTYPTEIEIFESITFTSNCTENAESYSWELESDQLGFFFGPSSKTGSEEQISNSWSNAGEYNITLEVQSKKNKYTDVTSGSIVVTDICYECVYESGSFTSTADYCGSGYSSKQEFLDNIEELNSQDEYTCTLKD